MSVNTSWNPESYAKKARFVSELGEPLLQLLAPQPGERILDLGCGDGALTEKIAAAGAIVYGADSSLAQVEAARRRGLNAFVIDGRQIALKQLFDAVFTNAVLHWIQPPDKVVEGVARCLKQGGRFVGEFGGKGNVETIRAALHSALRKRGIDPWSADPWYYPSPEAYRQLLIRSRFAVDYCELIPRPTKLPGDILEWLGVFAQPFTNSLQESARESFLTEVRTAVQPALRKNGSWFADYVRLRFNAVARP
ncbi:MAG: class I SAM-dependent methyltransferase [Candidatus Binatia bacterium]